MNDSKSQIRKQFNDSRCCVIIPTYNNIRTICPVIESVTKYTHNIIVVNDGSTDGTGDALRKIKNALHRTGHFCYKKVLEGSS